MTGLVTLVYGRIQPKRRKIGDDEGIYLSRSAMAVMIILEDGDRRCALDCRIKICRHLSCWINVMTDVIILVYGRTHKDGDRQFQEQGMQALILLKWCDG